MRYRTSNLSPDSRSCSNSADQRLVAVSIFPPKAGVLEGEPVAFSEGVARESGSDPLGPGCFVSTFGDIGGRAWSLCLRLRAQSPLNI